MAYRRCSECSNDLAGKPATAKTCGPKCRSKRSRRLKRQAKERGEGSAYLEHLKELSERTRGEAPDVAHQVIEEELRPVVRESITADTLKAISDMVALTPTAVAALQEDLLSEDSTIRQRAYTLLMKYTVGHHAIVTPDDGGKSGPMTVNFNLPRPSAKVAENEGDPATLEPEADAIVVRTCDICGEEKPEADFVANSNRCSECYQGQQKRASELLADADD